MAKIIILTASTGGGHDKAAQNLHQNLTAEGHQVHITQFMKEINQSLDYVVVTSYKHMSLRSPRTFGRLYKLSNKGLFNKRVAHTFYIVGKNKLEAHIKDFNPDLIIGTHLLSTNIIGALKSQGKIKTPFLSVVTDFLPHRSYIHSNVNAYLVGSDMTKNALIQLGIDSHIIFNYGMPLTANFYASKTKSNAPFTMLLMGGSIGLGFMDSFIEKLQESDLKYKAIVVCGKNTSLKLKLERKLKDDCRFDILGFTSHIDQLMDQSHIIITKPGGLTTTESIAKELPMLIPFAIPGQEEENTDFLVHSGCALKLHNAKQLVPLIEQLSSDHEWYMAFVKNIKHLKETYSIENTLQLIDGVIKGLY